MAPSRSLKRRVAAGRQSLEGLRNLQRLTFGAIIQPLGPGNRTAAVAPNGRPMSEFVAEFIKPNSRLSSLERLEIYNRQYWFRVQDSLYDDYPGLRTILGQRAFGQLCIAYLNRYPSASFTLRNLGSRLTKFLLEEPQWTGRRAILALDMSRFEWARIIAFDAERRPPLAIDDLLGQDPARLCLGLQPYLSILHLRYPLDDFILAVKKQEAAEDSANHAITGARRQRGAHVARPRIPRPGETFLAVHRLNNVVYFKRLTSDQYQVLAALDAGETLESACARPTFAEDGELAARELQGWFRSWMELGWFCRRRDDDPRRLSSLDGGNH